MVGDTPADLNKAWTAAGASQPASASLAAPALLPAPARLNTQNKKVVFLVGANAAAHGILRRVIPGLASMGVHVDIYMTRMPASKALQDKLSVPENRRFSFYEQLPLNVIYPLIEAQNRGQTTDDLDDALEYTPRELAEYFSGNGVSVTVTDLGNANDPAFVKKIQDDPDIVHAYNIRSMHILKQPIIDAFENKNYQGVRSYIANVHPGELPLLPGTHTAFWARRQKRPWMEWALHVIDSGIDTGPMLDTCSKNLSSRKTLMQDLMSMEESVAQMIVTNTRLFFQGRPRPALPQDEHRNAQLRPAKNYSYPTHQEWDEAWQEGIRPVNPDQYIRALTREYTGDDGVAPGSPQISRDIRRALEKAVRTFEAGYCKDYKAAYGRKPPVYTPPYMTAPASSPSGSDPCGGPGAPDCQCS